LAKDHVIRTKSHRVFNTAQIGFQTQMWVNTLQSLNISYVNDLMVLIVFLLQTIAEQNPRVVEHASGLAVLAVLNPKKNLWLQKCPDLQ